MATYLYVCEDTLQVFGLELSPGQVRLSAKINSIGEKAAALGNG